MHINEKKTTLEEYMQLTIGAPYQLINGHLIDWPSRTVDHQMALGNVIMAFYEYQKQSQNAGFFVMGPIEVVLDEKNSFQPDFVYVAEDRLEIIKDYIYGAPDLVVEVLYEKNAYYDLVPKKNIYEKYSVKEYIIIDPVEESAELYLLENAVYTLKQKALKHQLLNSVILPGLSFDMGKIFK